METFTSRNQYIHTLEVFESDQRKLGFVGLNHYYVTGSHLDVSKTINRVRTQVQWVSMNKDIREIREEM